MVNFVAYHFCLDLPAASHNLLGTPFQPRPVESKFKCYHAETRVINFSIESHPSYEDVVGEQEEDESFLHNPLNVYALVRHVAVGWSIVEEALKKEGDRQKGGGGNLGCYIFDRKKYCLSYGFTLALIPNFHQKIRKPL